MRGSVIRWLVVILLGLALAWQVAQGWRQLQASRLRRQVEAISLAQAARGRVVPTLIAENLRHLRRAAELDPLDPGIPMLLGSQYLLLDRPREAIQAYETALALEPRPEFYLNLGRALHQAGEVDAAEEAFHTAVVLDWRLGKHVPP